jgi:ankyrin repeat protein
MSFYSVRRVCIQEKSTVLDDGFVLSTTARSWIRRGSIKLLAQADVPTLQIPDRRGSLPLHIACDSPECTKTVKYLVELDKRSLVVTDDRGNTPLPLHRACLDANYDVIEMLLAQHHPLHQFGAREFGWVFADPIASPS